MDEKPRGRLRFGLRTLFTLIAICGVLIAIASKSFPSHEWSFLVFRGASKGCVRAIMGEPDKVNFYKTIEFWNYSVPWPMHCFVAFEDDRVTAVEYDD